ncbi:MAG: hypothetical protein K2Q06_05750 [Parvularculaceae bacterium]|nr:hypothetical protein [Parvularculaceae bacterium]
MRVSETRRSRLAVVKYGSSVLHDLSSVPAVVADIARQTRRGKQILAVVSAFLGETDRLLAEAEVLSLGRPNRGAAQLVSLGETRACAALAVACEAAGLRASFLDVEALGIIAEGPVEDATPVAIDASCVAKVLASHDVCLVPGFAALGADGRRVLLGRGGSDLSAVFLAGALGLGEAALVKDVDGVYDRDPAIAGAAARRLEQLDYAEALRVAGKLVQARAVLYAQNKSIAIKVRRLDADRATVIGAATERALAV